MLTGSEVSAEVLASNGDGMFSGQLGVNPKLKERKKETLPIKDNTCLERGIKDPTLTLATFVVRCSHTDNSLVSWATP